MNDHGMCCSELYEARNEAQRLRSYADSLVGICREFLAVLGPGGYYPEAGAPLTERLRAAVASFPAESKPMTRDEAVRLCLPNVPEVDEIDTQPRGLPENVTPESIVDYL